MLSPGCCVLVKDSTRGKNATKVRNIVLKTLGFLKVKDSRLGVQLVGIRRMKQYNCQFRHKDYATDVLSFPDPDELLGDLIVCPQVVKRNARRYGNTYESELIFVLIHGILHLLGYNHIQPAERVRMERKERQLLIHFGYQDLRQRSGFGQDHR